jgi:hypothetical protein
VLAEYCPLCFGSGYQSSQASRPPPIVLTSTTNLMQLQRNIKGIVTGNFEFRNTRSGTRIVTKEMADFSAIRKHLEKNNLPYFTFFPKSENPIKAVICHLPTNTPVQYISEGLVDLGFDIINVKQMSANRQSPSEGALPKPPSSFFFFYGTTARWLSVLSIACRFHLLGEKYGYALLSYVGQF